MRTRNNAWMNGFSNRLKNERQIMIANLADAVVDALHVAIQKCVDDSEIFMTPQELLAEVKKAVAKTKTPTPKQK